MFTITMYLGLFLILAFLAPTFACDQYLDSDSCTNHCCNWCFAEGNYTLGTCLNQDIQCNNVDYGYCKMPKIIVGMLIGLVVLGLVCLLSIPVCIYVENRKKQQTHVQMV